MQKVCKEGEAEDVFIALGEKLPQFLEHVFVMRKQAKFFEKMIQTLPIMLKFYRLNLLRAIHFLHRLRKSTDVS